MSFGRFAASYPLVDGADLAHPRKSTATTVNVFAKTAHDQVELVPILGKPVKQDDGGSCAVVESGYYAASDFVHIDVGRPALVVGIALYSFGKISFTNPSDLVEPGFCERFRRKNYRIAISRKSSFRRL